MCMCRAKQKQWSGRHIGLTGKQTGLLSSNCCCTSHPAACQLEHVSVQQVAVKDLYTADVETLTLFLVPIGLRIALKLCFASV